MSRPTDINNQQDNRGQTRKKKRRRVSKFRFYFINILLGIVIFAIIAVMIIYFVCRLTTIKVTGNTLYTDEEIQAYVLNDAYSNNTVYVFAKNLVKPRTDIPFVKSAKVQITGRDSIKIKVTEKDLLGYIALEDGNYAYFNEDGTVVEVSDQLIADVTQIQGLSCKKAKNGEKLDVKDKTLKTLLTLTKALKKYQINVSSITFEEDHTMMLQYSDTIAIDIGDKDNLTEKIMRLEYILPSLEGMAGTLHLENWSENDTDIVFKKVAQ